LRGGLSAAFDAGSWGRRRVMAGFRLRAHEAGDALAEARLLMRPAVRRQTMVFAPFTSEAEARAFMEAPVEGCNIVAVDDETGEVIGHIALFRGKKFRAHSASFGLAVHEDWHRRGVGSALLKAAIDTAENWLGVERIFLNVFTDNAPAIALYEKFGFVVEGTLRKEIFRDGRFDDAHVMARLTGRCVSG